MKEKILKDIQEIKQAFAQKLISCNEYQDFIFSLYQKLKQLN